MALQAIQLGTLLQIADEDNLAMPRWTRGRVFHKTLGGDGERQAKLCAPSSPA